MKRFISLLLIFVTFSVFVFAEDDDYFDDDQYYDDVYAHCTVVDYNIDVKKALQEHPEYENMIC